MSRPRPNVISAYRGGSHLMCALLGQDADLHATYLHPIVIAVENPPRRVDSFEGLNYFSDRLILIRDPRDICVGALAYKGQIGMEIVPWIESPDGRSLLHACVIWNQCQDEFIVRYEDLCENPDAEQQRIAERFGTSTSPPWSAVTVTTVSGIDNHPPTRSVGTWGVGKWQTSPYLNLATDFGNLPAVRQFLETYYD